MSQQAFHAETTPGHRWSAMNGRRVWGSIWGVPEDQLPSLDGRGRSLRARLSVAVWLGFIAYPLAATYD